MKLTIFYSWQSTTTTKYNKNFIQNCIEKATTQLEKTEQFKDIKFEILEGVTGEPGSPLVIEKIVDERIPNCDIFIADASVVNYQKLPWYSRLADRIAKRQIKPTQNNNVMFEYGVAKAKLGLERIIGVQNSDYGSPNDNPDNIPFDVRSFRFPIPYSYSEGNIANRDKAQKDLITALKSAIRDTANDALKSYKTRYKPFLSWQLWANYVPNDQKFISNEKIKQIYENLQKAINDGNKVIRILGLSGLGKTRIIFEFFRPKEDEVSQRNSGRALYMDYNTNSELNIQARIEEILQSGNEHLIILDNCPIDLCRTMKTRIKQHTKPVSLITLDNSPEENLLNFIADVDYIKIGKEDLVSVVDEIIATDFSDLNGESVVKIKEFSQGIPMMAVLLGESARKGEQFIGKLSDKDLLDKLLGDFGKDVEHKSILRTSALFNFFGYFDELEIQSKFLATNQYLTTTNNQAHVSEALFHRIINHYLSRQIYERKGRMIGMRPFPLAIFLAEEWLEECTEERLMNVIAALTSFDSPHGKQLSEAFAEQMKYLGFSPKANSIVAKITASNAPFDSAEVLNTELGSRLFRAFVQVNPVATAETLYRNFHGLTVAELLKIEEGRRNLIWALETLCFDERTFIQASKVLAGFAAAENENWGNNATGTLLHLFQVYLAGTEADLEKRFEIIYWLWEHDLEVYKDLSVSAISIGLNFGNFTRMIGSEKQGTKELSDFKPTSHQIEEYWRKILNLLKEIYYNNGSRSIEVEKIVLEKLRFVTSAGKINLILPLVMEIANVKNNNWDEAIFPLKSLLKYESQFLSPEIAGVISNQIENLTKDDFLSKFKRIVSHPEFGLDEDFNGEKRTEKIKQLAKEFTESDLDWDTIIDPMISGYMYSGFLFGKEIALLWKEEKIPLERFMKLVIKASIKIDRKDINWTILGGIYAIVNNETKNEIINYLSINSSITYALFQLIPLRESIYDDSEILFNLVDTNKCSVQEFYNYLGRASFKSSLEQTERFCRRFFAYGIDGYFISFKIAKEAMYNSEVPKEYYPLLKEIICKAGIVDVNHSRFDRFEWWHVIGSILNETNDNEFAKMVNVEIINSISWENTYHLDNSVQNLYSVLINKYFDPIWPDISKNLISIDENYVKFYGLKHILGSTNGSYRHTSGILFDGNLDLIFTWCKTNSPLAPIRIANMTPIFSESGDENKSSWHEVAIRLIDQFGHIDEVLHELDANMNSFSWTGSVIPYLRNIENLMLEITNHPIQKVRDWASATIKNLHVRINFERNRDEEMYI